jgi:AraC-like DNA-binding protein
MVLFDRSWYNRAGVERVMGFCTEEEYQEFLRACPLFEEMLIRSGIKLIKYWFSVSDDEQERRFQARLADPAKHWKLSPMDLESRSRWVDYSRAKDVMFAHTDTDLSPWWVVEADVKRRRAPEHHHAPARQHPVRVRGARAARAAPAPERRGLRPPAARDPALRAGRVLTPRASRPPTSRRRAVAVAGRRGTIPPVTRGPLPAQQLLDLARLRRVRDRIDREYAQPLDVEALARGAHMSAGHLSREFRRAYGESPYSYLMTRRIERAMALLRAATSASPRSASRSAARRWAPSARASPSSSACRPASTARARRATAGMPPCVAKQVTRPVRNREAPSRAARSVTAMDSPSTRASSRRATRTRPWPSTATPSASRSATTSATAGMRWITVGPPAARDVHRPLPAGRRPASPTTSAAPSPR